MILLGHDIVVFSCSRFDSHDLVQINSNEYADEESNQQVRIAVSADLATRLVTVRRLPLVVGALAFARHRIDLLLQLRVFAL